MKTIGITGGTGFVGSHLTRLLTNKGYQVTILTRNAKQEKSQNNIRYAHWDTAKKECDIDALEEINAMVHLAGAGIADKRWTAKRKQEIVSSRVDSTRFIIEQLKLHGGNCHTFLSTSATGYYGPDKVAAIPFKEDAPPYPDFLGETCVKWETEAEHMAGVMRTVILRSGIVLGKESGAFVEFEKPTRFGLLPILGPGQQIISWIEVGDLARMILFALENDAVKGIFNAVAPNPVSNKELMQAIHKAKSGLHIPVHAPAFALKLLLGEMSTEILKSCTVSSKKIEQAGFTFQHPTISQAVKAILKR